MIHVKCPHCEHVLECPDPEVAEGMHVSIDCPKCQKRFEIPGPSRNKTVVAARVKSTGFRRGRNGLKLCPFCQEEIQATATKCKHCGQFLPRPWYSLRIRSVFLALGILFLIVCAVKIGPLFFQKSDLEQGHDEGVQCVRQLRAENKLGILTEPALLLGDELFQRIGYPHIADKSPDYQAGFRAGLREEIRR
jgi:hypothetical protein